DADVFVGLSVAGAVTPDMIKVMAKNPIVFAMANPEPEILPDQAKEVRDDIIMATGRSDFPNQINNVLGFPFIFRGALDVRATTINEEMKLAAVHAIARLAKEDVPDSVSQAYAGGKFKFGPEYIVPKPFDPRVLLWVAPAVAKAAMDSGVAQKPIEDFNAYKDKLEAMQGTSRSFIRGAINRVRTHSAENKHIPTIVFPEAHSERILRAITIIREEQIATPILVGYPDVVKEKIESLGIKNLDDVQIVHPSKHPGHEKYFKTFYDRRKRKGITLNEASRLMADPAYFAAMTVEMGDADAIITGATQNYADAVRPVLRTIGTTKDGVAGGLIIMVFKDKVLFFLDTTVNIDPTAEQLASLSLYAAEVAQFFGIKPKIAMLSFSNFTGMYSTPKKMQYAAQLVKQRYPDMVVDGEMQADTAINENIRKKFFPFSQIDGGANILMFPNLDSSNIGYKLVQQLSNGEVLGPFLMGVRKPAHVLQRSCSVEDIVNVAAITALHVQYHREMKRLNN
ncbi:MAG: NADP-dependent malic enzyme, partial [Bdellovibrionales bacterium]|nr:NADP-dependent malic enzyme [Bdellovibrionales bacterium]